MTAPWVPLLAALLSSLGPAAGGPEPTILEPPLSLLAEPGPTSAPFRAPSAWIVPPASRTGSATPALEEMRAGRFWHATRLLREDGVGPGAPPASVLLLARAEAGWGHWSAVEALLDGASWLDDLDAGVAWALLARAREDREDWPGAAEAYGRYLSRAPVEETEGRRVAATRRILALVRAGDPAAGLAVLGAVRTTLPAVLASWTSLEMVRILADEGRPEWVPEAVAGIADADAARRARPLAGRAQLEAGDTVAALTSYRTLMDRAREEGDLRGDLGWTVGELALSQADTVGAREAFLLALESGRGSGTDARAAAALLDIGGVPSGEVARDMARALVRRGEGRRALEALDLAADLDGIQPSELPGSLRLLRARLLATEGRSAEAAEELATLGSSPDASLAGPALEALARLRFRQGRREEALGVQDRLVREHPGTPEAVDVVFFRGDDLQDGGLLDQASEAYERVARMAPTLDRAGLARMRLGQIRLARGEVDGASEVFLDYLEAFPDGRRWDEASYWAARSLMSRGDSVGARRHVERLLRRDPLSYYAILAFDLTGEAFAPAIASAGTPPPRAWMVQGLELVKVFLGAGLVDGAGVLLERLAARASGEGDPAEALLALGSLLNEAGLTREGIRLGWRAREAGRPWDTALLRVIYPFPYQDLVRAEALEWGVDHHLLAALIRQESAFWHEAVSGAGAVGLMQVLPSTGRQLARAVGPPGFDPAVLTNPEVNVHLGARFLVDMLDRFGPELPLVLSAYNAGPTRALRWRRLPEADDPQRFTERIPFGETRDYVKRVSRNLALYRWLYDEESGEVGQDR